MSAIKQTTFKLNNGMTAPALGLGTWQGTYPVTTDSKKTCYEAVKMAIDAGYRHFDTSPVYLVEDSVGDAIKEKIQHGVVKREDLFVVSKLWGNCFRPDLVENALKTTLADLQLDYLDLYLMHWPMALKEGDEKTPTDQDGNVIGSDVKMEDTWRALEQLVQRGLVKSIGLSNFNSVQVDRILKVATIKPVTNQVECHPYLAQEKLSRFCADRGIPLTAYAPLGSPGAPWGDPADRGFLEDQRLKDIAEKHGKTPAQVVLRYQVDRGHLLAPKSANENRIRENINIFDFSLTNEEVDYLTSLNKNIRLFHDFSKWEHLLEYPFKIEF